MSCAQSEHGRGMALVCGRGWAGEGGGLRLRMAVVGRRMHGGGEEVREKV